MIIIKERVRSDSNAEKEMKESTHFLFGVFVSRAAKAGLSSLSYSAYMCVCAHTGRSKHECLNV